MKSFSIPRAARKTAAVCLALVAVVTNAHARTTGEETPRAKYPTTPIALDAEGGAKVLAFPPRAGALSSGKPLTVVYLHGIHGRPENGCPWFREGSSELGWLVCPAANERLPNGTFSWAGTAADQRAVIARAERAAAAEGRGAESPSVLVGFSQGAFVAMDLVHGRLGRYRGLVLIGADVAPTRAMLEASGVARVVLAAGDLDGASGPMKRATERLRAQGMDARFVSLGRIGHSYETTEKEALRDAIVWVGGSS